MNECGNKKVILGCGNQKKEGFIGLDKGDYGQEIVKDICNGLPFCENSCEELIADQLLEHIQLNEDFIFVMNECLRVLRPGGIFYISVPHYASPSAHKDPTHCRYFEEHTFSYLEETNPWEYGFDKRWKNVFLKRVNHYVCCMLMANKFDVLPDITDDAILNMNAKIEEVKENIEKENKFLIFD